LRQYGLLLRYRAKSANYAGVNSKKGIKMRFILGVLLILIMNYSFASGWATKDNSGKIASVNVEGGLVKVFYTANDLSDPDGCGNKDTFILKDDTKNGDRQYSAILASHMSQRPIKVYVSGCYTGWNQTWPKIHAIFAQ
jgi:hypothetical protein